VIVCGRDDMYCTPMIASVCESYISSVIKTKRQKRQQKYFIMLQLKAGLEQYSQTSKKES